MNKSSDLFKLYDLRNNHVFLVFLIALISAAHFYILKDYSLKTLKIHYSNNLSKQTSIKAQLSPHEKNVSIKKLLKKSPSLKKRRAEEVIKKEKLLKKSDFSSNKHNHMSQGQADLYAKYITGVRQLIAKNKFYPLTAKRLHHQGTVKLKLTIGENGKLIQKETLEPPAHSSLERAALKTLKSIDNFGEIPKTLNKKSITIIIPIIYELI